MANSLFFNSTLSSSTPRIMVEETAGWYTLNCPLNRESGRRQDGWTARREVP
jgi:hypothetical protein